MRLIDADKFLENGYRCKVYKIEKITEECKNG